MVGLVHSMQGWVWSMGDSFSEELVHLGVWLVIGVVASECGTACVNTACSYWFMGDQCMGEWFMGTLGTGSWELVHGSLVHGD